ncbi:heme oxygenase (biliverdin-producing) [Frigoribacterium sp. 2-23]|uniref:biliverdin-producing heme oxygenase n=1 Tax=Frigoribacterium sp. 2-23 TaxID=3415006 RepID=UPI003C704AE6
MSVVIPLSQALRERASRDAPAPDGCAFLTDLMTGRGTRDDYVQLLAQHFFVYEAMEAVAESYRDDPVAARFLSPALTRLPAIRTDLEFLLGAGWEQQIEPLPVTRAYVDRIHSVAGSWVGGFVAHHYTRCLGDLSGGQILRGIMQREFGFETNGVGFFLYAEIAEPRRFKDVYRRELDAVGWSDDERERVIAEALVAYEFSTRVFVELGSAKAAAAAA